MTINTPAPYRIDSRHTFFPSLLTPPHFRRRTPGYAKKKVYRMSGLDFPTLCRTWRLTLGTAGDAASFQNSLVTSNDEGDKKTRVI